jgi:hypothetical protein
MLTVKAGGGGGGGGACEVELAAEVGDSSTKTSSGVGSLVGGFTASATTAAGGTLEPGLCIEGCSGAIEVPSELSLPPSSPVTSGCGVDLTVFGWLTDRWGIVLDCVRIFGNLLLSGSLLVSRGFTGDVFVPSSELLRRWPFDLDDLGCSLILILLSRSSVWSSSRMVSTETGLPPPLFHLPAF